MERLIWMLVLGAALYFAYWSTQLPPRGTVARSTDGPAQSDSPLASDARRIKMGRHGAGPEYFDDFDSAMDYARSVRKPMVVVFGADYCGACHQFVEVTCVSSDIQKYYDRYVWVYLDTQKQPATALRRRHPDRSFRTIPHLWYFRWDGAFIADDGYISEPMTFAARLEDILSGLPSSR